MQRRFRARVLAFLGVLDVHPHVDGSELSAGDVAAEGTAILLVEHDVDLVFDVADRVYAMAEGKLLASGTADEVRRHPAVQEAYLNVGDSQ